MLNTGRARRREGMKIITGKMALQYVSWEQGCTNSRVMSPRRINCCIPSKMFEARYAGVDRAAGSRGMLVQARAGHLRIDILVFQTQLLGRIVCRFIIV